MSEYVILALAAFIIVYALISKRLSTTVITGTILFVAFGLLIGPKGFDMMGADINLTPIKVLFEATLVVVLFNDAMAINAKRWRKGANIPGRLLGIGLPLTVVFGFAIALAFFTQLDVWEAALVGAILAPTDAALGQAVISNPRVSQNIRQGLSVLVHGVTSVWGANRYADWYQGKTDIHEEMEESGKVPEIRLRIRNNPFGHRAKT